MQSDRRLVQHIQHAAQLRADLRCQTNALPFTTAQGRRRTVQRDIAQPDRVQKSQPLGNFLENPAGDLFFPLRKLDLRRGLDRARHRQRREIGNGHAVHLHRQTFRTQPLALTCRDTWSPTCGPAATRDKPPMSCPPSPAADRQRRRESRHASSRLLRAIENQVLRLARQLLERRLQVESIRLRGELQDANQILRSRARP
jgi:hypothetical protein